MNIFLPDQLERLKGTGDDGCIGYICWCRQLEMEAIFPFHNTHWTEKNKFK